MIFLKDKISSGRKYNCMDVNTSFSFSSSKEDLDVLLKRGHNLNFKKNCIGIDFLRIKESSYFYIPELDDLFFDLVIYKKRIFFV